MVTEKLFVAASILYGVATYFYDEKVRGTMRTALVSNLLKLIIVLFLLIYSSISSLKSVIKPIFFWLAAD